MRLWKCGLWVIVLVLCAPAYAHPVPRKCHDRTIVVRLAAVDGQLTVTVDYQVEVDTATVILDDLPAFEDQIDLKKIALKPDELYDAFTRFYAPVLADNLVVKLDGKPVTLQCTKRQHVVTVQPHLQIRGDFIFEAKVALTAADRHEFYLRETNYHLEEGRVSLSFADNGSIQFVTKVQPSEELKAKRIEDLKPGDDRKLREVKATFTVTGQASQPVQATSSQPANPESATSNLLGLLLDSERGFWMLLGLATVLGGAHALTPGHGKTLVAAYLVGERGTVWHAMLLGVVTTLTHTGVVLILAAVLRFCFPQGMSESARQGVNLTLGLAGGLVIAGLGFWLMLQRLAGQADHYHLPAHSHHHHHEPANTSGTWGLIVLGINGGIIPCWDAVVMLIAAVAMNLLWFALPLLLAFSAGLAGVLILIGIVVVKAKGLAGSRWDQSRLFRALPILSAAMVTCLGLWLCYDSVHGAK